MSSQPIVEMGPEFTGGASASIEDIPDFNGSHGRHEQSATAGPEADGLNSLEAGAATTQRGKVDDGEAAGEPESGGVRIAEPDNWILIRRFNYLVFRVRAIKNEPLVELDMAIAGQEQNTADKLQAHMARLYMTVIIGLFGFWKHIVRLRSWREHQRTAAFLSAYIVAWLADLVAPTLLAFITIMMFSPSCRSQCFPPIPPSIINASTGGLQKPPSGVLASVTSVTGAPESQKGEAIETEAHSFITSVYRLMARITVDQGKDDSSSGDGAMSSAAKISEKFSEAKNKTDQEGQEFRDDKTTEPMKHAIEDFTFQPLIDGLVDFIDDWERFANALEPNPLIRATHARISLAVCLALSILVTVILARDVTMRMLWFCAGFAFFGRPIIRRGCDVLDSVFPTWRQLLKIRKTILKGIPTNAQLAIAILRDGEQKESPLPPPPIPHGTPEFGTAIGAEELNFLGATKDEMRDALVPETDHEKMADSNAQNSKSKTLERLMRATKRTSKHGVRFFHAAQQSKADSGDVHARERLDLGKTSGKPGAPVGPQRFPTRFERKTGYICISTTGPTPCICWTKHDKSSSEPTWALDIAEVDEISKVDGISYKTKQFVSWALDKEAVNGLEMTAKGQRFYLSEVVGRDQLFNRLIAIGSQVWEVC